MNITYIAADIGLRLAFSVDNHVYFSKELSGRSAFEGIISKLIFSKFRLILLLVIKINKITNELVCAFSA